MQALRILASRWVVSFAGIAILALLVWFFGPLLEPLEGWVPRLAIVLALLLVWGISNLLLDLRRRRREQRLESGVAEKAPGEDPCGGRHEHERDPGHAHHPRDHCQREHEPSVRPLVKCPGLRRLGHLHQEVGGGER